MTGLRRMLLIAGVWAVAAIPGWGQAAPATVPDLSGMWAHPSLPGMEPLASGPTSLVNLSRRRWSQQSAGSWSAIITIRF